MVDVARLLGALPFPIMLEASPCKPDHELPQRPENVFGEAAPLSLPGLRFTEDCDRGISRVNVRGGGPPGFGDRCREPGGDSRGEARRVLGALW